MASMGPQVRCAGDRCNKMVFVEPNKPSLCQLHARALQGTQAFAKLKEVAAVTQAKQEQARYRDKKWQKDLRRRKESQERIEARAQEAQAGARAMPPPPIPRNLFRNDSLSHASRSVSTSGYSPALGSPIPRDVYRTIARAMAPRLSAPSRPRRLSREDSVGLGNKVSKTGRVRQADFLFNSDDDENDLPSEPIGSMASPPRPTKHNGDKQEENLRYYDDYSDANDMPINTIYSLRPSPRSDPSASHRRRATRPKPILNRQGGIVDSDEEDEPVGYEETRRSMRNRFKPRRSEPIAQLLINRNRDARRGNDDEDKSDQRTRPKRIRFDPEILAQLSHAEDLPAPKKTWAVPKKVKANLLPPPEISPDTDPSAELPVANLEIPCVPDNHPAPAREVESYAASESGRSQRTVALDDKIHMLYRDHVAGDGYESPLQARSHMHNPAHVAQSVAQTEEAAPRFERALSKNRGAPNPVSAFAKQPHTPSRMEPRAEQTVPVVFLPSYQPLGELIKPSYRALDATDSGSSTSSGSASPRSVKGDVGDGALHILQSLPNALKQSTLESTTPQKGLKHGTAPISKNGTSATENGNGSKTPRNPFTMQTQSKKHKSPGPAMAKLHQNFLDRESDSQKHHLGDEELPSFDMDYPQEDEGLETDTQMFDLLKAMDREGNVVDDQTTQLGGIAGIAGVATNKTALQTISAKALRASAGLPADSPISEQMMFDLATRVQYGALTGGVTTEEQPQEGVAEIEHELTIDEFETKKKKYDEEKEKLTRMMQTGEDITKQKMVVKLLKNRLDEFVAEKGLRYMKEKTIFE